MNQRNVETLAQLLADEIAANGYVDIGQMEAQAIVDHDPEFPPSDSTIKRLRKMAEYLDSVGVEA